MTSALKSKTEKSYLSAAVDSFSPWTTSRSSTPKPSLAAGSDPNPQLNLGADHSVNHRYGLSLRRYPQDCPKLQTQWFYAVDVPKRKPILLKETPKDAKPPPQPKKFVPFTSHDSRSIEAAFQRLVEQEEDGDERERIGDNTKETSLETDDEKEDACIDEAGNLVYGGGKVKVPVNEDFLFEVDIERRELAPVYWLGPIYEVRRGTWFYQESSGLRTCEENLAAQLEEGYLKVKPFRYPKILEKVVPGTATMTSGDDTQSLTISGVTVTDSGNTTPKLSIGDPPIVNKPTMEDASNNTKDNPPTHEPQTHRLFGTYMNSIVTYQDENIAWLSSDGIISRMSSTVYQRFAGGGYLGGVKLVRGFTGLGKPTKPIEVKSQRPPTPNAGIPCELNIPGLQFDEMQQKILKRRSAPPGTATSMGSFDRDDVDMKPILPATQEAALKRQISSLVIDSIDSDNGEEAVRRRDAKEIETDYVDHDGEDQARKVEHLILVTHGIGQRLGMRTESVNFIHDVNVLRQTLKSVYLSSVDLQALNSEIEKIPKNCRVQVLPVCWRHLLDFPRQGLKQSRKEHDLGENPEDDEEYPSLDDITVEGVPFVRSLITDLALDILLYQSAYREHITGIVLRECNRIYKLFVKRNPDFDGKVSLIGHSLGSAILFDILCRQKEDSKISGSSQHSKYYHSRPNLQTQGRRDDKDLSFEFAVEDFYCLGSPIGLFQMLKGRTVAARHHPGAFPAESPMDSDDMDDPFLAASNPASHYSTGERISSTTGLPYTISSPKCFQLYNIFHPSDPISYRLEPLIAPAMSALKPQLLPYTKKGIFASSASQGLTGIGARVGQSVSGFWSSLSSGIASSLLNRSLGLNSEDIAGMTAPQSSGGREPQISAGAGTNISSGGVISNAPNIERENTNEKKRLLAEETIAADRQGSGVDAPTLIDDEIETLYSGFQKTRKSHVAGREESQRELAEAEEKGTKLRREELKVKGLNRNGRVDFSIQESVLDFNPINTIASHLSYWADEDVSHFMMSQLLSRHRKHNPVAGLNQHG